MRNLLSSRVALLLVLVATVAVAKGREPHVRNVYFRDTPENGAAEVYVTEQVVTVLRFQQPCDAAGTKMLGWEGRFEPVVCAGKWVLVVPLQALESEDRFMLVVRLADGTEVPFTVSGVGGKEGRRPDQQVNVFLAPESRDALQAQLKETLEREQNLLEEVQRRWREDTADHALAKLLASGAVKQTPFTLMRKRLFKGQGEETMVRIFSGKTKAAVLFSVTNHHSSKPWNLSEARLVTIRPGEDPEPSYVFGSPRRFALRQDRDEIAPGESGNVAVVVDRSAFQSENGPVELVLELYREDGWRQAYVVLDHRLARD
jgi:uncharacterized protein (TIGR02268 family)